MFLDMTRTSPFIFFTSSYKDEFKSLRDSKSATNDLLRNSTSPALLFSVLNLSCIASILFFDIKASNFAF